MKKLLFVLWGLSLFALNGFAQGIIKFEKTDHNFGSIKEENGPAQVSFEFTNTGTSPLTVTNVQPSCGCTTPTWTKEAIAPGKTGIITASYDPVNRPGRFDKTINVYTDGQPNQLVLRIMGEVIPRPRGINDWYPNEIGSIRVVNRNVYFNQVYHDGKATQKLTFYNQSAKPITINVAQTLTSAPKHILLEIPKNVIQPQDSVQIQVTFDATKQSDWDYVSSQVVFNTDDSNQPMKLFYIGGNVVENFGNITAQTKLPLIKFDRTRHDFGKVNQNTNNTTTFKLINEGNAPLIIRKTKASCGCTAGQPQKTTLAPGESTNIDVTFASGTKQNKQNQTVTIISNDPANPRTTLYIEADVIAPAGEIK
ncbi:MAG: DUF1573 domain-containing protein [Microscillaceae bacterium]|jgi:hypothetical protein|nr:DUF1573 domain-containing protein [Microscillaceae bacterium]